MLTQKDVRAIYSILQTQTPGAIDSLNPQFKYWMNNGLKQALKMSKAVDSRQGYYFVIKYYVNGFHDEHVIVNFDFSKIKIQNTKKWVKQYPGFFVKYKDGIFIITSKDYSSESGMPPKDAKLVSCDNQSVKKLMNERVFPYHGNTTLNSDWTLYGSFLLLDDGNPFLSPIKECRFLYKDRYFNIKLNWRKSNFNSTYVRNNIVYTHNWPASKITKFGNDGSWVYLPSFWPDTLDKLAAIKSVMAKIRFLRNEKVIVFDVRGNSGGSSEWGSIILSNLYGKEYFNEHNNSRDALYSEWRVTKENIQSIEKYYLPLLYETVGKNGVDYQKMSAIAAGMQKALENGKEFYKETLDRTVHKSFSVGRAVSKFTGHIFVLTDGRCGSACLDFLDEAKCFANVIQIGRPTHADTNYVSNREVLLPSGICHLTLPMKVERNRGRASNQPHIPKYIYSGDINNTDKLRQWINKLARKLEKTGAT
ncbi:MAG: hypothetical protein KAS93_02150 [Gammaproteobacteria bacterium]|nr:hypothetical protein [Gammaproteobacteria bacterium]